jgi:hypothetical protein
MHYPWILPKLPGRFYYYFGKPIETEGMGHLSIEMTNCGRTNFN